MNKRKEIERLKGDIEILQVIVKAYQRENERLKKDLDTLNASLDAEHAERMKWDKLAHKIDKMRVESIYGRRKADN